MRRIAALAALASITAFATAAAAGAGTVTNTTISYAYSGYVSCANGGAGEYVTGTIDAHILETSTTNDNVDASKFQFDVRGTLIGSITGDAYRLAGVTHGRYVESETGTSTLTFINRYRLIGPGAGNNLVVRETAHITRHGDDDVVARDEFSVECS